jgi:hypothetical protein
MATLTKTKKAQPITFICPGVIGNQDTARSMIASIVGRASANSGFVCISGYKSDTGREGNYVVQPYGPNAYPRLVRESLLMLERQQLELPENIYETDISSAVWNEALLEQMASYRKTLDGGHDRKDSRKKLNKGFYELNGSVYVANIRIVKVHETATQAKRNALLDQDKINRIPKSEKAKAKHWIRKNTPAGNFRGQFRLDEDKFDRIAFSGIVIEFADYGELFTS